MKDLPAKFLSLVTALSMLLAMFLLPETVCAPGSEVNACCAAGECHMASSSCLCCHPGIQAVADAGALPALAKSLPLVALPPVSPAPQPNLRILGSPNTLSLAVLTAAACEAKPNKLYILNRSLLI